MQPSLITIDRTRLYPLIVPAGYLPAGSPSPARMPLLDGLEVALVIDHPGGSIEEGITAGLAEYVRDIDLTDAGLTLADAYRIAIENLMSAAENGLVQAAGASGPDGKVRFVIWADHWLAATCLLLPGVYQMASSALSTKDVVAAIPHRDVLIMFADKGPADRAATAEMIRENEKDGRKPITSRLLRVLPGATKPFYEEPVVAYLE